MPDYAKLRAERAANLTRPDGLLSTTSVKLDGGDSTIGSAKDNSVVIEHLPAHLGVLHIVSGSVKLVRKPTEPDRKGGSVVSELPRVSADDLYHSTAVGYMHLDGLNMAAIEVRTEMGVLVKDPRAQKITHFPGLTWYPPQARWRVAAKWVPYTTPHRLTIGLSHGQVIHEPAMGYAEFSLDGQIHRLVATEDDGHLFFVVGDLTNGTETYGSGRFLESAIADHGMKQPGTLMMDFNELTNPYCSYAFFLNCPRPTDENKLPIKIEAGEKRFPE